MNQIDVINVSKTIKKNLILDDVSLHMESGKIYGLIGRNGSGKTMLIRSVAGILEPTEGEIRYNGKALYKDIPVIPDIGVVIGGVGLYPELTGMHNLMHLADIRKKTGKEQIREAILRVGLNPDDKRCYRKYSLGMKQRIIIAQAIMEKPDVLLMDEPTNGLDEDGVELARQILREERERGCLVVVASHNAEDIALLCDEVFKVSKGKLTEEKPVGLQ